MAESLNAEILQDGGTARGCPPPSVVEDFEKLRNFIQRYEKRLEHDRKLIESQLFDHLPVAAKSREIRVDPLPLQLAF